MEVQQINCHHARSDATILLPNLHQSTFFLFEHERYHRREICLHSSVHLLKQREKHDHHGKSQQRTIAVPIPPLAGSAAVQPSPPLVLAPSSSVASGFRRPMTRRRSVAAAAVATRAVSDTKTCCCWVGPLAAGLPVAAPASRGPSGVR